MRRWVKVMVGGAVASALAIALDIRRPVPTDALSTNTQASAEYWSRDGELLHARVNQRGARCLWRTGDELPLGVRQAFIALEDKRFYEHDGVDWRAMARVVGSVSSNRPSGGSTISMQLARLLNSFPRTGLGKLQQIVWALRLEQTVSKEVLLEQYLNRVPLGRGIEGVEAAAHAYFGKTANSLSDEEALFLAALAPAPSRLDPRFSRDAACAAFAGATRRLSRAVSSCPATPFVAWSDRAPHFGAMLASAPGKHATTLDVRLQQESAYVLARHRQQLLIQGVEHAALVLLDARSGELRALLGSFDFDDARAGQVNAALARRQAGSILKPFLYGEFLDRGASLETQLYDGPRCFRTSDELFCPRDYDDAHRGTVSLKVALASSLNIPAVEVLERLGFDTFHQSLVRAGILTAHASRRAGLGLALGDVDVRLLDVTRAFAAATSDGVLRRPPFVVSQPAESVVQLVSNSTATSLRNALSDIAARRPGFGASASTRHEVLKTGTSTWARDLWALAANDDWVVGVWLGNADGAPTDSSAIEAAAPIAIDVLDAISPEVKQARISGELP